MRCLWITRQDPRPADSGDLIYSLGLLRALAATGSVRLTVLAHHAHGTFDALPEIDFVLPAMVPEKSPRSLLTKFPSDAYRLGNPEMRRELRKLLVATTFDRVVIDQAASGWALDLLPPGLPLLYLSHNHEATVRTEVASSGEGSLPLRLALKRDAANYARLERALCARASGISAITPRDEAAFRAEFPDKRYAVLSPGYDKELPDGDPPEIITATPRRVVLAGTFEWIAKRRNLEGFLKAASAPFAEAGIEFHVVGKASPVYFRELAERYPRVKFEANVPSMEPYLRDARIGLIPESLGGGFKLKALDYIFRGLPLASIEPALSGLPLVPGEDCIAATTAEELAAAVTRHIDDLEFLNHAAKTALERCRGAFRWSDRGQTLAKLLNDLTPS